MTTKTSTLVIAGIAAFALIFAIIYTITKPKSDAEPYDSVIATDVNDPAPTPTKTPATDDDHDHDEDGHDHEDGHAAHEDIIIDNTERSTLEPQEATDEEDYFHGEGENPDVPTVEDAVTTITEALTAPGSFAAYTKELLPLVRQDFEHNITKEFRDYYHGGEIEGVNVTAEAETWGQAVVKVTTMRRAILITVEASPNNDLGWELVGISLAE